MIMFRTRVAAAKPGQSSPNPNPLDHILHFRAYSSQTWNGGTNQKIFALCLWLPGAVWEAIQMLKYEFKFISSSALSEDCNMKSKRRLSLRLSPSVKNASFGSFVCIQ